MLVSGEGSLAIAAAVVLSIGSSTLGIVGTIAEMAIKEIDKDEFPNLRTISEVFAKTLQSGAAAFSLLILGSLFVMNSVGLIALGGMGVAMLLTPSINCLIQHHGSDSLKIKFDIADNIVNIASKTINTAVVTAAFFMSLGVPAGILGGIGVSALSIATYQKA